MAKPPDPFVQELLASALELRESFENTRRASRILRRKPSVLEATLAEQSRKQLSDSRNLLAKT